MDGERQRAKEYRVERAGSEQVGVKQPARVRAHPVLQLQHAVGNRATGQMLRESGPMPTGGARVISRILAINEPGGRYEQEADQVADRAMAAPASAAMSGAPLSIQRLTGQPAGRMGGAPASVEQVLASPGMPLGPVLQQEMEERFGHNLAGVRVHTDAAAEQSARDLNAHAYTVGSDIVFGAGRFAPGTHLGRRLVAHELAHVVQQSGAGGARLDRGDEKSERPQAFAHRAAPPTASPPTRLLQRQPAGGSAPHVAGSVTPSATWEDLWRDFTFAKISRTAAAATVIAKQLVEAPAELDDLLKQGLNVVRWLRDHGEPDAAARLLGRIRVKFILAWATDQPIPDIVMDVFSWQGDPIDMARSAARAGKHDEAFSLLGTAHEVLSMYVLQTTEQRQAGDLSRGMAYFYLDRIYDRLREIYEFYFVLEQEALAAGDAARAAIARTKAAELVTTLKQEYSLTDQRVEVAEASSVTTSKGPALRLEGANAITTDLTMLPGLRPTQEIGDGVKWDTLHGIQDALTAQAELQAEIGREPEIRTAFGNTRIELTNSAQRQKVWGIMLGVYERSGPGAVGRLMVLIGKYLKAFTSHTEYNIRDFGANYLTSQFPIDLAGRVEMDCGVYALSVAWDTYQALKQSKVRRDVTFRLVAFLDHVSLIIDDRTGGEFYVVNNDQITAVKADPEREAQKQYGAMRGLFFLITPSYFSTAGSTKQNESSFRTGAWAEYLKVVSTVGSKQTALMQDLKKRLGGSISAFGIQKQFSEDATVLHGLVDQLKPFANDPAELAGRVAPFMLFAIRSATLLSDLMKAFGPLDAQRQFTVHWPNPNTAHPLVRFALVLLRMQKLGGTITTDQQRYLQFIGVTFKAEMAKHRQAGEAGRF